MPTVKIVLKRSIIKSVMLVLLAYAPGPNATSMDAMDASRIQDSIVSSFERRPKIAAKFLKEIERDILLKERALYGDTGKVQEMSGMLSQMRSLYRSAHGGPMPPAHPVTSSLFAGDDTQAIDSDGEFPTDDDDDEFFDAQEFGGRSQISSVFRSTMAG